MGRLANEQFAAYARLFAGHSRETRRPERLEQIRKELASILGVTASLPGSVANARMNESNQKVVRAKRTENDAEVGLIRAARSALVPGDLASALLRDADAMVPRFETVTTGAAGARLPGVHRGGPPPDLMRPTESSRISRGGECREPGALRRLRRVRFDEAGWTELAMWPAEQ